MSEQPTVSELEFDLIDRLHKSLRVSNKTAVSLGSDLGIHRNTVNNYLSGRTHPGRRTIIAWALATGVPVEWLEHGIEPSSTPGPEGRPQSTDCRHDAVVVPLFRAA